MFTVKCSVCGKDKLPLSEASRIDGKVHCDACLSAIPADEIPGRTITKLNDPSICLFCEKIAPSGAHKLYDGTPICNTCVDKDLSKPFPLWVKAFFAGILVLVVFSIAWNWRFFTAYKAIHRVQEGIVAGDINEVVAAVRTAHEAMPENYEFDVANDYYTGVLLLGQDSSEKALPLLERVNEYAPGEYADLPMFMHQARMANAFEAGDHATFLLLCKQDRAQEPAMARSYAGVASAYACLYTATNDTAYRDSAFRQLDIARTMQDPDSSLAEYEQRIRYRIASREIISAKVFHERFPEGWHQ